MGRPKDDLLKIALHRYEVDAARLQRLLSIEPDPKREGREMIDRTGRTTKVVRSDNLAFLLRAYATRRVVCAGRLLVCFDELHDEVRERPILGKAPGQLAIAIGSTDFQRTGAKGRGGFDAACHTAPCQIVVEGAYPWYWSASRALQQRFVESFADTYQMPQTVNDYDAFIDRGDIGGAVMFLRAVELVMQDGASPLDVLPPYVQALRRAIERTPEMRGGEGQSWVLACYVEALHDADELVVNALAREGARR